MAVQQSYQLGQAVVTKTWLRLPLLSTKTKVQRTALTRYELQPMKTSSLVKLRELPTRVITPLVDDFHPSGWPKHRKKKWRKTGIPSNPIQIFNIPCPELLLLQGTPKAMELIYILHPRNIYVKRKSSRRIILIFESPKGHVDRSFDIFLQCFRQAASSNI